MHFEVNARQCRLIWAVFAHSSNLHIGAFGGHCEQNLLDPTGRAVTPKLNLRSVSATNKKKLKSICRFVPYLPLSLTLFIPLTNVFLYVWEHMLEGTAQQLDPVSLCRPCSTCPVLFYTLYGPDSQARLPVLSVWLTPI